MMEMGIEQWDINFFYSRCLMDDSEFLVWLINEASFLVLDEQEEAIRAFFCEWVPGIFQDTHEFIVVSMADEEKNEVGDSLAVAVLEKETRTIVNLSVREDFLTGSDLVKLMLQAAIEEFGDGPVWIMTENGIEELGPILKYWE